MHQSEFQPEREQQQKQREQEGSSIKETAALLYDDDKNSNLITILSIATNHGVPFINILNINQLIIILIHSTILYSTVQ